MIKNLHEKADSFVKITPYFDVIRSKGALYFTGSYFLNTMTWADLDMQLCLEKDIDPKKVMSSLSAFLIKIEDVQKVQFIDFSKHPHTGMPTGLYLGVSYFDINIKSCWKLDLWILSVSEFKENRAIMERLKKDMTPEKRELIIMIKKEWTDIYGRPPKGGSFALYQAVVFEKLKTRTEIDSYLRDRGINV